MHVGPIQVTLASSSTALPERTVHGTAFRISSQLRRSAASSSNLRSQKKTFQICRNYEVTKKAHNLLISSSSLRSAGMSTCMPKSRESGLASTAAVLVVGDVGDDSCGGGGIS